MAREALFNSDSLIDEPCEAEIWDKSLSQRGYTKLKSARSIRFSRVTKELLGEALINKGSIVLRSDSLETKITAPLVIVARILGLFLGLGLRLLRVRAVFDIGMSFVVAMGPKYCGGYRG